MVKAWNGWTEHVFTLPGPRHWWQPKTLGVVWATRRDPESNELLGRVEFSPGGPCQVPGYHATVRGEPVGFAVDIEAAKAMVERALVAPLVATP